jgi:hypothetical protein
MYEMRSGSVTYFYAHTISAWDVTEISKQQIFYFYVLSYVCYMYSINISHAHTYIYVVASNKQHAISSVETEVVKFTCGRVQVLQSSGVVQEWQSSYATKLRWNKFTLLRHYKVSE